MIFTMTPVVQHAFTQLHVYIWKSKSYKSGRWVPEQLLSILKIIKKVWHVFLWLCLVRYYTKYVKMLVQ